MLAWALATRRWWLLPLIGVLGGLAKETFIPLSIALAGTWWLVLALEERRLDARAAVGIVSMAVAAIAMPTIVRLAVERDVVWPWALAAQQRSHASPAANLRRIVADPGFY